MTNTRAAIPILRTLEGKDALAALARMGDENALKSLLSEMPTKDVEYDLQLLRPMRRIAYTKRKEAIDLLLIYLQSEVMLSGDVRRAVPVAKWAANILSNILIGCPDTVQESRAWMAKNYSSKKLESILGGEIQRWD